MPEIYNSTGSDILGGNWKYCPQNIPEFEAFSIFSPIFPLVNPESWALPPQ